uniref:Uncharacterized protein n=1 Tax=Anguilla anguilla TaxID=7936 RepID=A0A0E9XZI2_ANGAN
MFLLPSLIIVYYFSIIAFAPYLPAVHRTYTLHYDVPSARSVINRLQYCKAIWIQRELFCAYWPVFFFKTTDRFANDISRIA